MGVWLGATCFNGNYAVFAQVANRRVYSVALAAVFAKVTFVANLVCTFVFYSTLLAVVVLGFFRLVAIGAKDDLSGAVLTVIVRVAHSCAVFADVVFCIIATLNDVFL